MQQITSNVYAETQARGCNFGFVTTSEGVVMIDSPHKPSDSMNMPGHTLYQAAISIKEEGVCFTSDNIFRSMQTWLHEANPDLWLVALESLRKLDEETFVPGHGELCDKGYLDEQGAFVQEWKEYVKSGIDRGLTKDEAVANLTAMVDRYPMDVGQDGMAPMVMGMCVANLYDYLTGNWPAPTPPVMGAAPSSR